MRQAVRIAIDQKKGSIRSREFWVITLQTK